MNERWTIDELATLVEKALRAGGYDGQGSGRVRTVPDLRTIRYYTTIGLLDPPVEMRGRKAFYGRRHVLQLAAVKQLQAQGMPLVEVQRAIAGADDRKLARWAALPDGFWEGVATVAAAPPSAVDGHRARGQFWAVAAEPATTMQSPEADRIPACGCGSPEFLPRTVVHLPVAEGAELVLEGFDPSSLDAQAMGRLTPALENLAQILAELRSRTS